jgi:hypothetical protein
MEQVRLINQSAVLPSRVTAGCETYGCVKPVWYFPVFVYVKFLTILLYEDSFIRYPQKVIKVIFNFERLSLHVLPRHVGPEGFRGFP